MGNFFVSRLTTGNPLVVVEYKRNRVAAIFILWCVVDRVGSRRSEQSMPWLLLLLGLGLMVWAETYCYDNCSGNGECVDYICQCHLGWFGENCSTRFGTHTSLQVGLKNLSSAMELEEICSQQEFCLVGFSSLQCAQCAREEQEYANADFGRIPFLRVDVMATPDLFTELVAVSDGSPPALPFMMLVWDFGRQRQLYRGKQTSAALTRFAQTRSLEQAAMIWEDLNTSPLSDRLAVVGFFASRNEDGDEMDDFQETAKRFQFRHDLDFFQVFNLPRKRKTRMQAWYPPLSVSLPAIGVLSPNSNGEYLSLTEGHDLIKFIQSLSLAVVRGRKGGIPLTTESFLMAEQTKLPMLLLFSPHKALLTSAVLDSFHSAAVEFDTKLVFLYDAQHKFASKMHVLGLDPTAQSLSMAINTRSGAVPFHGGLIPLPFREFCIDFLAGRLKPQGNFEPQHVQQVEDENEDVVGVSESVEASAEFGVVDVSSRERWSTVALDDTKDVLVFVHRTGGCADCKRLAPYFKATAKRFLELHGEGIKHHVVCAVLDLSKFSPNSALEFPSIVLLPAHRKQFPLPKFSAVVKVFPIMEWTRVNAGRRFAWNQDLPQFDPETKQLFKTQIQQREQQRIQRVEL
ncbi:hypothetical protein BASA81_000351 [Batrachochytrium salamandrivorans]|nr:hypothetical protein BASA81_000351 [Batrachochytrium salamandrivorans]